MSESTENVMQQVKQIIVDVTKTKLPASEMKDSAHVLNDCGVDSVTIVDLILSLEEKFSITIGEEEIEMSLFDHVSNLAAFVEEKATANASLAGVTAS